LLPLNEMYQKLLSIRHIALEPFTSLQPLYPNWYKPNLTYEYHVGTIGHNIHSCNTFKKKLMQLIKAEWITFEENLKVECTRGRMPRKPKRTNDNNRVRRRQHIFSRVSMIDDEVPPQRGMYQNGACPYCVQNNCLCLIISIKLF